ncbi:MAG: iron uptake system protein EfeO [Solirubrobacteraceae bacterium]
MRKILVGIGRGATIATCLSLSTLGLVACGSGRGSGSGSGEAGESSGVVKVTLTEQGCSPTKLKTHAGSLTFAVTNGDTSKVSELELKDPTGLILGEHENVVPGLPGSFTLNMVPGKYFMNCPNGEEEDNGVLIVTGKASAADTVTADPLVAKALAGYRKYIQNEVEQLLAGTRQFKAWLELNSLKHAKEVFGPTRRHYEAIEPVAESFAELDTDIDARINDVANASEWKGFHRIEQILWVKNTTQGTGLYAEELLADVIKLDGKVSTLKLQAPQLANGAVELLNEIATSKITGEEDRYSHTDLSDFEGNLTGARVAFELLRPVLIARGDGALANEIAPRFAAVQRSLDRYRRKTPLGFAYYGALTPADRLRLSQQVDALAEPMSNVAAKVSG